MAELRFSSRLDNVESQMLVDGLNGCPLASGLGASAVAHIASECSLRFLPARSEVFSEGEDCAGLWVLLGGRVRLQHLSAEGRHQATGFRSTGDVLEVAPVIDEGPHMATALTLGDVCVGLIPRSALTGIRQRYPETTTNLMRMLCTELRQRDIASGVAALKNARSRIGCTLLHLIRQYGVPTESGVRIAFRITRQDIADRSGVTIETSVRVLSEWQRTGLVRTDRQVIDVLDLPGLKAMAGCGDCLFDCSAFAPLRSRLAAGNGSLEPLKDSSE
jgi:CRP-like cAMP-binding protein